jgi:hypothetical protein
MIWVDCKKCNPILNNSLETKSTNTPLTSIDISPIDEFDNRKLESILKRANIRLPEKLNDKSYRKRLIKVRENLTFLLNKKINNNFLNNFFRS